MQEKYLIDLRKTCPVYGGTEAPILRSCPLGCKILPANGPKISKLSVPSGKSAISYVVFSRRLERYWRVPSLRAITRNKLGLAGVFAQLEAEVS